MTTFKPIPLGMTPEFMSEFGRFFGVWANAEMALDFAIGKLLGIPHEETHLITAGADFNRKARLLQALVQRKKPPRANEIIKALRTIQNESLRNVFSHSYYSGDTHRMEFVERSRHENYDPKVHIFTMEQFEGHVEKLLAASHQFTEAVGIPMAELQKFVDIAANAGQKA
jgi:hypothetical protein